RRSPSASRVITPPLEAGPSWSKSSSGSRRYRSRTTATQQRSTACSRRSSARSGVRCRRLGCAGVTGSSSMAWPSCCPRATSPVARICPAPGQTAPVDLAPVDPDDDHGTHVAGIAAGDAGTRALGAVLSGVAPHAYIGNYRALTVPTDSGVGKDGNAPEIVAAIEAAVADGMNVINLSIGEPEIEPTRDVVALALDGAAAAGVVPVVSA